MSDAPSKVTEIRYTDGDECLSRQLIGDDPVPIPEFLVIGGVVYLADRNLESYGGVLRIKCRRADRLS